MGIYTDDSGAYYKEFSIPMFDYNTRVETVKKASAICQELIEKDLIISYHWLFHTYCDVRLKSNNWDVIESEIVKIIQTHGILVTNLKDWDWNEWDVTSFNSKDLSVKRINLIYLDMLCAFVSSLISIIPEAFNTDKTVDSFEITSFYPLSASLWIHYIYNTLGFTNAIEGLAQTCFGHHQILTHISKNKSRDSLHCGVVLYSYCKYLKELWISMYNEYWRLIWRYQLFRLKKYFSKLFKSKKRKEEVAW